MAWGPQGETKREERPVTKEELEAEAIKKGNNDLARFAASIQEGDEVYFESESNNHRGYSRYRGHSMIPYVGGDGNTYTRTGSFHYTYTISSFMS